MGIGALEIVGRSIATHVAVNAGCVYIVDAGDVFFYTIVTVRQAY